MERRPEVAREHGAAVYPRQLSEMFGGVVSEAEIRALTRRREEPLPCIASGAKRPHRKVFPAVFAAYLAYEMGSGTYAEVEHVAGQCAMGAWS